MKDYFQRLTTTFCNLNIGNDQDKMTRETVRIRSELQEDKKKVDELFKRTLKSTKD